MDHLVPRAGSSTVTAATYILETVNMSKSIVTLRTLILAGAVAAIGNLTVAHAGQCPADKVGAGIQEPPAEGTKPVGVTDDVLASTDLSKEPANIAGRLFRIRRLVVQPGGVVPWHDHANRPALIYIVDGAITEYSSACSVPIEHKAGEVAAETHVTKHWWKNNTDKPTTLISDDLFPTEMGMDKHTM
jgi:quercetin dioxygenase-like cupin family protein